MTDRLATLAAAFMDEGRCNTETGARSQAERILTWGCCDQARPIHCSEPACKLALHCPEHGATHYGHEQAT